MSFASILRGIVEQCGGGLGAALMGSDGIPIEQVVAPHAAGALQADDVSTIGVEFGRILDEVRKASDALSAGAVVETVIVLARFTLVFRSLDEDTFLILVLAPDGNLGKARYLLRRQLGALQQEL
jgi:predicted regulator of Ras-like GTPase activity (Roadblock/LC7/MglB family)